MKKNSKFLIMISVMVVLFLATSLQAADTIVKKVTAAKRVAAEKYWTPEKIASAKSMDLMVDNGPGGVDESALAAINAEAMGVPGSSPGGLPAPGLGQVAQEVTAEDFGQIEDEAAEDIVPMPLSGTKGEFTYYDVNYYTQLWQLYPHKTVGRVTFTTATGNSFCTATVISNNHIVTAAHCVYDTTNNRWYSNWIFTPAYRNGSGPYGSFTAHHARILTTYVNLSGSYNLNAWARYDVALIELNPNASGRTVNQVVGYAGRSWNYPYTKLLFHAGYPQKNTSGTWLSSPGAYLRSCTAESFAQTTETLGMGCLYASGNSGGPWFMSYKPIVSGANNYVNSVTSGHFNGQQNTYGARFNSSNIVILCRDDSC